MIPFDRLDSMMLPLEERLEGFYQRALTDSARSLSSLLRAKNATNPALWYGNKYIKADQLFDSLIARIAKLTPQTEEELRVLFKRAGIESMKPDADIIGKLGLKVPELATTQELTGVINAVFARTNVVLQNLTRSVAYQAELAFIAAADEAYLAVTTGTLGIDQAVKQGVLSLAKNALLVTNPNTGRKEQADVAIKRNVWTAVNQATGDMTLQLAAEVGTDYVEVSAHAGARNTGVGPANHESWQGKVYSISGRDPKYAPFKETTGYGTGPGLLGWNCRHSLFLHFPGFEQPTYTQAELDRVNNTTVTYRGQEMDLYSATQHQRYLERGVRDWKRKQSMFEAAGLGEEHQMAGVKVQDWQSKLRDFTNKTGLQRRYEWEQVAGVKAQRPAWGKTIEAKPAPKVAKVNYSDTIEKAERANYKSLNEVTTSVDANGNIILVKHGTHSAVDYSDDELKLIRGNTLTHNHPFGWDYPLTDPRHYGNSFSRQDLSTAIKFDMPEMRVTTPKYIFSIKPNESGWPSHTTFESMYRKIDQDVKDEFWSKINNKTMTIPEAEHAHAHEVNTRLTKFFKLQYSRVEHGWE